MIFSAQNFARGMRIRGVVTVLATAACSVQAQSVMKVSVALDPLTQQSVQTRYEAMGPYLEKRLGIKLQWVTQKSDAAVLSALVSRKIDMAWISSFTYAQLQTHAKDTVVPLVQRDEDAKSRSVIIASAAAKIQRLTDLKGHTFSYGPKTSMSGHIMPRVALQAAKINPETDFKRVDFATSAEAVVAAVAAGRVDAGALAADGWEMLVADKKVDPQAVKVVSTTPVYADYHWAIRADIPEASRAQIASAFLALEAVPGGKAILTQVPTKRFIEAKAQHYDAVLQAVRQVGVLQPK